MFDHDPKRLARQFLVRVDNLHAFSMVHLCVKRKKLFAESAIAVPGPIPSARHPAEGAQLLA